VRARPSQLQDLGEHRRLPFELVHGIERTDSSSCLRRRISRAIARLWAWMARSTSVTGRLVASMPLVSPPGPPRDDYPQIKLRDGPERLPHARADKSARPVAVGQLHDDPMRLVAGTDRDHRNRPVGPVQKVMGPPGIPGNGPARGWPYLLDISPPEWNRLGRNR
jgi:hypothetical protein